MRRLLRVICLIAFCSLALLVVRKLIGITYAINDDPAMMKIAAGITSGEPDGHMIFVRYPWSGILALLFKFLPGIDWHGSGMLALQILSYIVVTYYTWETQRPHESILNRLIRTILVMSVFILFSFKALILLQFTLCAAVLSVAAIIIVLIAPERRKGQCALMPLWVIILQWFSFQMRDRIFLLLLPSFLVALLFRFIRHYKQYGAALRDIGRLLREKIRTRLVQGVLWLMLISVLFGGSIILHDRMYAPPEWQDHMRLNRARAQIVDYFPLPEYEAYKTRYAELGVDRDLWQLINSNTMEIDARITPALLENVVDFAKKTYDSKRPPVFLHLWQQLRRTLATGLNVIMLNRTLALFSAFFLTILYWFYSTYRRNLLHRTPTPLLRIQRLLIVIFFLQALGCLLFLAWRGRTPERVILPLYMSVACFLATALAYTIQIRPHTNTVPENSCKVESLSQKKEEPLFSRLLSRLSRFSYLTKIGLLIGIISIFTLLQVEVDRRVLQRQLNMNYAYDQLLEQLKPPEEAFYFYTVDSFSDMYTGYKLRLPNIQRELVPLGGWRTESPPLHKQWLRLGLDTNQGLVSAQNNSKARFLLKNKQEALWLAGYLYPGENNVVISLDLEFNLVGFKVNVYKISRE